MRYNSENPINEHYIPLLAFDPTTHDEIHKVPLFFTNSRTCQPYAKPNITRHEPNLTPVSGLKTDSMEKTVLFLNLI